MSSDDKSVAGEPSREVEGGREEAHDGAADDLEEEECAFCKFMKAGPCGKIFKEWEECVDMYRDDADGYVNKCFEQTKALKECMDRNPHYYSSMLGEEDEEDEGIEDPKSDGQSEEGKVKSSE